MDFQAQLLEIFNLGRIFFQEEISEKLRNTLPNDTGYRPLGVEYSQSAARPDQVESFSICRALEYYDTSSLSFSARALHEALFSAFDSFEATAEKLAVTLAEKLTGRPYTEKLRGGLRRYSLLQLNYSQPAKTQTDYINETHEDGSFLTLTLVTAPGLEIQDVNGSFLPVAPDLSELLVMSGEILSLLTGGEIRPVLHRVARVAAIPERMSLLFFADLDPALCQPWVSNETNAEIDIGELVRKNPVRFGLSEWRVEQPKGNASAG
jgi:isopenicillin N synthase-like dioxygenase